MPNVPDRPSSSTAGSSALDRWASCGAMWLTGADGGPPLSAPAPVAASMDHWAGELAQLSDRIGRRVLVDGAALLAERAAIARLRRRGGTSAGGHSRLIEAADGWVALSLPRPDDVDLLPAWLDDVRAADGSWLTIAELARHRPVAQLIDRAALLGLPCGGLGERAAHGSSVVDATSMLDGGGAGTLIGMRVVDLSSLWAGPLCAHLLGLAGARVVKVESVHRPDGARFGPPAFYDLLHAGHESVALDLATDAGLAALRRLVSSADVVIEASRPRALDALGCSFEASLGAGFTGVWLSITAHGRDGAQAVRVGFGDDAAVAGGLVAWHDGAPVFVADAVADPATGLVGAVAVADAVAGGRRGLLAVSLAGTAAHLTAAIAAHGPVGAAGPRDAAEPRARTAAGRARPLGADTEDVLRTW